MNKGYEHEEEFKILNQLKLIIFDSNASKEEVEYNAEYDKESGKVSYYLKLKDFKNYILSGNTRLGYISKSDYENAIEIINSYKSSVVYKEFLDLDSFNYYNGAPGSEFEQQYFFEVKNSNILFFPNLEKLLLVKNVRISGGLFNERIMLSFSKSVTLENFATKLEELEIIKNTPSKDLLNIIDTI